MLFAQIDAVYAALDKLGYKDLRVQISETGWPSDGDEDEVGASPENAKKYNGKLLKIVKQKHGTPARPDYDLNIFVFALFNENLKPGPTSERNFGLFKPDGTPVYNLGFSGYSGGGNSGHNNTGAFAPPFMLPPGNPSYGYYTILVGGDTCLEETHWNGNQHNVVVGVGMDFNGLIVVINFLFIFILLYN
ncbi:hypothetical protein L1987_81106 [Smallanthus sonchifolius]|uniref:Uncharacterized protein n=1 Tax=Smallanthus sonchifolius TaxID=185202 RepID=A0ACB8YPJ3_9ASTR|nr:hypothetical protein L1987_81106 [Smallanthus sonchifolius]